MRGVRFFTTAVAVRPSSVAFSRGRAIVAVLSLHNAVPVFTAQRSPITPDGHCAPVLLCFRPSSSQLVRMVHTSTVLRTAPAATALPRAVFVKVGNGPFVDFDPPAGSDLMAMRKGKLLQTIADSKLFADEMKGMTSRCTVSAITSNTATVAPTVEELAHSKVLEGLDTLADTVGAGKGNVWVHIRQPTRTAAARFDLAEFNNVLTAPRDSSVLKQQQDSVAVLADGRRRWSERLAALSEVTTALQRVSPAVLGKQIALPLFSTPSHTSLLAALAIQAEQLQAGNYENHNGIACRTLAGARGIGKSTVLRAFTYACKAAYPDIIPLYLTAAGLLDPLNCFQHGTLQDMMVAAARTHGVQVEEAASADPLTFALEKAGKRMLVIVDEIEELYRVSDLRQKTLVTLSILQRLGDQISGRYAVLICGSAAATYRLISAQPEHLTERFPLLKDGVPDLNGTKFARRIIPSARCTHTAQVHEIILQLQASSRRTDLHGLFDTDDKSLRNMSRILTFYAGTTPRTVVDVMQPGENGLLTADQLTALISSSSSGTLPPEAKLLFDELLRLLVTANQALVDRLRNKDGGCDTTHVLLEPWENDLTALPWSKVSEAWSSLAKGKGARDESYLYTLAEALSDAGLISLRVDPGTEGLLVWPATVAQLVYYREGAVPEKLLEGAAEMLQPLVDFFRRVQPLTEVRCHFLPPNQLDSSAVQI